ncbi:hypothetical protein IP91_00093 [Pseudoduganella lurida]|uniref:Uncharacterized protein n=1 Tax=Pseudoduganella lurida TaxID=1036180 RepID=A0A562RIX8_9BURK|nr:hypothetical protein [Pseudoduganella lurida]TWI69028.1 hypothetical protein IP91_00093 [Pseudoduganella lurida]
MPRTTPTDEQYDEKLTEVTRAQHATIMAALKAGEPNNTTVIDMALSDYLSDENALAALIKATAAGRNPLQAVINDLVWTEAEERARAELARLERERVANDIEDRAERAAHDRLLDSVLV